MDNKKIIIEEYYTEDSQGNIFLHRKIGDTPWEKILTPYREKPYVEFEPSR